MCVPSPCQSDDAQPVITEVGAGTGYYLSHVLDSVASTRGIGIDVSTHAAELLAVCHPRVGAVVADVWSRLPIRDASVDAITVVFAPRNATEFARIGLHGYRVQPEAVDQLPGAFIEDRKSVV